MLKRIIKGTCDLLYPPRCQNCFKLFPLNWPKDVLCPECLDLITLNTPPFCLKCSRRINEKSSPLCLFCQQNDYHFDFCWTCCVYEGVLKELIHRFKFYEKTYYRFLFSKLMIDFINRYQLDIHQFDALLCVPLSTTRQRERGFNQAQLLAEIISHHFNIALITKSAKKISATANQAQLSLKNRFTNLNGAFRITSQREIFGKNILIIDDVLTTAATASELAKTLKCAGAKRVGVLTLATTI